ncbi:hypothetical protein [Kitasatospora purpeofusca]|uniref:hypothetical protein n=1 Tax=Kitasatospora purpeofusca TaxID=67352 RepID=UPI0036D3422D
MLTTDPPAPAAPAPTRRSPARLPPVPAAGPGLALGFAGALAQGGTRNPPEAVKAENGGAAPTGADPGRPASQDVDKSIPDVGAERIDQADADPAEAHGRA